MADGELNVDSLITRLLEGERGAGQPRLPAAPRPHRGGREGAVASPRPPRGSRGCRWGGGETGGAGSSRAATGGAGAAPPPRLRALGGGREGARRASPSAPSLALLSPSEGGGALLSVLSALVCAGFRPPCLGEVAVKASLSFFPLPALQLPGLGASWRSLGS